MEKTYTLDMAVRGMNCNTCPDHVERALRSVAGVRDVEIPGWRSDQAIVIANESVTDEALAQAVEKAGYGASVKTRNAIKEKGEKPKASSNGSGGNDFDLLIIGAGSAGFASAIKGVDLGAKVGLIGDGAIGGTCVNVGCLPSKALMRASEAWHNAAHHPFKGVNTTQGQLDWSTVRSQKNELVADMQQSKYVDVLAAYPDITYIEGYAQFTKDGKVQVGDKAYKAKRYVIVSGGHPRMLPFPGADEVEALSSTTLMELEELPKSLIVLGGRAIALELGQSMARFGVEVLILQRSTRLLPEHEPAIGRAVRDIFEQEGIGVITGVEVEKLSREGEMRTVHAKVMGQAKEFRAEQILMALGREANTKGMRLENVGVELDAQGAIIVDERMQSSNEAIYAAGDVTDNPEFVYVAAAGGSVAAQNALAENDKALDLSTLPAVIFTNPQIATVGMTEAEAKAAGHQVKSSKIDLEHVARAQAARDLRGFIKLVADKETNKLLGAHIIAAEAGEVIQTATLAIKFGLTIENLTDTLFPYLTQVEGLKLAALAFDKDLALLSCCAG